MALLKPQTCGSFDIATSIMWRFSIKTSTFWFAWPGNLLEMLNEQPNWHLMFTEGCDFIRFILQYKFFDELYESITFNNNAHAPFISLQFVMLNNCVIFCLYILAIRPDFWNDTANEWQLSDWVCYCKCARVHERYVYTVDFIVLRKK